jgi:hypothetical protein
MLLTYHWDFGDGDGQRRGAGPRLPAGGPHGDPGRGDGYVDSAAAATTEVVAPSLSVGDLVVWEGRREPRRFLQVRLSAASPRTVTVSYLIGGPWQEDYLVARASGPSFASRPVRVPVAGVGSNSWRQDSRAHETIRLTLSDQSMRHFCVRWERS